MADILLNGGTEMTPTNGVDNERTNNITSNGENTNGGLGDILDDAPAKPKTPVKTDKYVKLQIPNDDSINNKLNDDVIIDDNDEYSENIDDKGYPLIFSYLWDIGDNDDIEALIDSAIRLLLIHPMFEDTIWKDRRIVSQIYNDNTFWKVPLMIPDLVEQISNEITLMQIERKRVIKGLGIGLDALKSIMPFGGKKKSTDDNKDNTVEEIDPEQGKNMNDAELFGYDDQDDDVVVK